MKPFTAQDIDLIEATCRENAKKGSTDWGNDITLELCRMARIGMTREVSESDKELLEDKVYHSSCDSGTRWRVEQFVAQLREETKEALDAVQLLVDSMYPHPIEHPTMFKAKNHGLTVLSRIKRL